MPNRKERVSAIVKIQQDDLFKQTQDDNNVNNETSNNINNETSNNVNNETSNNINNETSNNVNNETSNNVNNETGEQEYRRQTYFLTEDLIQALAYKSVFDKMEKSQIVREALKQYIEDKYFKM